MGSSVDNQLYKDQRELVFNRRLKSGAVARREKPNPGGSGNRFASDYQPRLPFPPGVFIFPALRPELGSFTRPSWSFIYGREERTPLTPPLRPAALKGGTCLFIIVFPDLCPVFSYFICLL